MIKNTKSYLVTAGGKIRCRRCTGTSNHTKKQCKRPALKSSKTSKCKFHGGASTGPKTQEGKERIRAAHWKHGNETQQAKSRRSKKSALILHLIDIGAQIGMLPKNHPKGRKSKYFRDYDLTDPNQLVLAIQATISSE